MGAVTALAPDLFRVDLAILAQSRPGSGFFSVPDPLDWLRGKANAPVMVDPYLVARAILEVVGHCQVRSPAGGRLVWNEYLVFLAREDHDRLRPLEGLLHGELRPLLREQIKKLNAETVGEITVRLLVDEGEGQVAGTIQIRVKFVPAPQRQPTEKGEITIRVGLESSEHSPSSYGSITNTTGPEDPTVKAGPVPVGHLADGTERIPEPGPGVRLTWRGGRVFVPMGKRVVLGRPHADPRGSFIALDGASSRISRRHCWVEPLNDVVEVGRLADANPVQVHGRLLQPGGRLTVEAFPVEISLSSGDLVVGLDMVKGS